MSIVSYLCRDDGCTGIAEEKVEDLLGGEIIVIIVVGMIL